MDMPHEQTVEAAIITCDVFLERLSSLDDDIRNGLDNVEDTHTLVLPFPRHFHTNEAYRDTFLFVLAHEFRFREWRHLTILLQYMDHLRGSVNRELGLLHTAATKPGDIQALRRWQNLGLVEAGWPFSVPVESKRGGDEVIRACQGMWTALRIVAVGALENEQRTGSCVVDLLQEWGVARRRAAVPVVPAETLAFRTIRYMGGVFGRQRIKKTAKEKEDSPAVFRTVLRMVQKGFGCYPRYVHDLKSRIKIEKQNVDSL